MTQNINKYDVGDVVNIRAKITGIWIGEDEYRYEVIPVINFRSENKMQVKPDDVKNRIRKL